MALYKTGYLVRVTRRGLPWYGRTGVITKVIPAFPGLPKSNRTVYTYEVQMVRPESRNVDIGEFWEDDLIQVWPEAGHEPIEQAEPEPEQAKVEDTGWGDFCMNTSKEWFTFSRQASK